MWVAILLALSSAAPAPWGPSSDWTHPIGQISDVAPEPEELRARLREADAAVVGRGCGEFAMPWGYRGTLGAGHTLRVVDGVPADSSWTRRLARLLMRDTTIDAVKAMRPFPCDCDSAKPATTFVASLHGPRTTTTVALLFDIGVAIVYDDLRPLGAVPIRASVDSLWSTLHERLPDATRAFPAPRPTSRWPPRRGPGWPTQLSPYWTDHAPRPRHRVRASYPPGARRSGVEGTVRVLALVGIQGTVEDAVVIAGPPELRDSALEAAWKWTFKPGRVNQEIMPLWRELLFTFGRRPK